MSSIPHFCQGGGGWVSDRGCMGWLPMLLIYAPVSMFWWYSMVFAWYCMVLLGIARYGMVLQIVRLHWCIYCQTMNWLICYCKILKFWFFAETLKFSIFKKKMFSFWFVFVMSRPQKQILLSMSLFDQIWQKIHNLQ